MRMTICQVRHKAAATCSQDWWWTSSFCPTCKNSKKPARSRKHFMKSLSGSLPVLNRRSPSSRCRSSRKGRFFPSSNTPRVSAVDSTTKTKMNSRISQARSDHATKWRCHPRIKKLLSSTQRTKRSAIVYTRTTPSGHPLSSRCRAHPSTNSGTGRNGFGKTTRSCASWPRTIRSIGHS